MFGPPGHLYVYFTYGMHHCCNVSCGPEGEASALLLRAGEVVEGLDAARQRRPRSTDRDLARGPGRLCRAMGIDLGDNGLDLASSLRPGPPVREISTGPRVGLRLAAERPWRFWITGDPTVSRYVPAKQRADRTDLTADTEPARSPLTGRDSRAVVNVTVHSSRRRPTS